MLAFVCAFQCAIDAQTARSPAIRLNTVALEFARELIREGRAVSDQKGAWRRDQPSIAQKNEFIHAYGFDEYEKWHLGIDDRHSSLSKAHYKFPLGDFINVHRCGLLAVKARAHEYGYRDIESAASQLLALLNQPNHAVKKALINSGKSSL
jgi:hypothetical protein